MVSVTMSLYGVRLVIGYCDNNILVFFVTLVFLLHESQSEKPTFLTSDTHTDFSISETRHKQSRSKVMGNKYPITIIHAIKIQLSREHLYRTASLIRPVPSGVEFD